MLTLVNLVYVQIPLSPGEGKILQEREKHKKAPPPKGRGRLKTEPVNQSSSSSVPKSDGPLSGSMSSISSSSAWPSALHSLSRLMSYSSFMLS